MPLKDGDTVTFAGVLFRVGHTEYGGTCLTPIDDPLWWYRSVAINSNIGWDLIVSEDALHDSF